MEERQEDLPQQEETFADENATPAPGGTEEPSEADVEGDDPGEEGTAA
jgi:hypothetical protein